MYSSVYEFRQFYASRPGRLMRRILSGHIQQIWPDLKGLTVLGGGYAVPYLKPMLGKAEKVFSFMPPRFGVHHWPEHEKNLVCLASDTALPFETEAADRIIVVHGMEHAEDPQALLQECWRVLKSNGRLLLVVSSRMGLWSRADWTPFGHGTPYTATQIAHRLHDSLFAVERMEKALFMPPFRSFLVLRTAYTMENFGRYIFPGLAGIHLVEAGKQVYAGIPQRQTAKAGVRRYTVGQTAPTG